MNREHPFESQARYVAAEMTASAESVGMTLEQSLRGPRSFTQTVNPNLALVGEILAVALEWDERPEPAVIAEAWYGLVLAGEEVTRTSLADAYWSIQDANPILAVTEQQGAEYVARERTRMQLKRDALRDPLLTPDEYRALAAYLAEHPEAEEEEIAALPPAQREAWFRHQAGEPTSGDADRQNRSKAVRRVRAALLARIAVTS